MSKAVRLVCAAFCAASATAGVVSCVCRPWYTIATTEMEQQYSMFSICLNTTCRNYGFDFPNSSHSASSVNDRFVIFWIAALLGIVLDLTGALLCLCDPRGQKLLRVAVLLAGFLLLSASTAIFGAVMQNWVFSGAKYCASLPGVACKNTFGWAFYCMVAAAAVACAAFAFSIAAYCWTGEVPEQTTEAPTETRELAAQPQTTAEATADHEPTEKNNTAPEEGKRDKSPSAPPTLTAFKIPATNQQSTELAAQDSRPPDLPEGDWTFVADCGMYWSEENYMYLHLESGQFYDPNSGMWYNSETAEWFYPEEPAVQQETSSPSKPT